MFVQSPRQTVSHLSGQMVRCAAIHVTLVAPANLIGSLYCICPRLNRVVWSMP